jgi:hypothetical protein
MTGPNASIFVRGIGAGQMSFRFKAGSLPAKAPVIPSVITIAIVIPIAVDAIVTIITATMVPVAITISLMLFMTITRVPPGLCLGCRAGCHSDAYHHQKHRERPTGTLQQVSQFHNYLPFIELIAIMRLLA